MAKLMVVTTYVDEIPLHAGGLIANHAEAGDEVVVIVLCYPGYPSKVVYPEAREEGNLYGRFKTKQNYTDRVASKEKQDVAEVLGINEILTLDYEAYGDELFSGELIDKFASLINKYTPDIVVTHWPIGDYTDFIAAGSGVMRTIISKKLKKIPRVYFSETLTGKHTLCFKPTIYVDISETMEKKRKACSCIWKGMTEEYFFWPFAEPIASFRGRECGVRYAEAYAQLYGTFGILRGPGLTVTEDRHPMSVDRTVKRLVRGNFREGTYPTYGPNQDPKYEPDRKLGK